MYPGVENWKWGMGMEYSGLECECASSVFYSILVYVHVSCVISFKRDKTTHSKCQLHSILLENIHSLGRIDLHKRDTTISRSHSQTLV